MTNTALAWGSACIAFAPVLSLLFFLSYPKAQLVIVVTTAAFFFLCSALIASLIWYLLAEVIGLPGGSTVFVLLPGVLSQFLFRCAFVHVYHVVEQVIQSSLERYELQHPTSYQNNNNDNTVNGTMIGSDQTVAAPRSAGESDSDDHIVATESGRPNRAAAVTTTPLQQQQNNNQHHWARLQLELNDFACAIAAATGFGGMHAIFFYGTLLASETSMNQHATGGTLFQPSCLNMPSLVVSAIMTCLFSILDVFWMLLTFFGMRRRLLFHRSDTVTTTADGGSLATATDEDNIGRNNSRGVGNYCLVFCLLSHMAASLATSANLFTNGCIASLPLLGIVTIVTATMYMTRIHRIYLPPSTSASSLRRRNNPNYINTTTPTTAMRNATAGVTVAAAAATARGQRAAAAAAPASSTTNRNLTTTQSSSDPYHRD